MFQKSKKNNYVLITTLGKSNETLNRREKSLTLVVFIIIQNKKIKLKLLTM